VALLPLLGIETAGSAIPPLRMYLSDEEISEGAQFRRSLGKQPFVGIHAGTSTLKNQAARRWPKERFAELVKTIPDAHFAIFGTAEEAEVNRHIVAASGAAERITLVDNKTLRQAAAIIRACDFFISNDSGLMHLAAAMQTPVIAIIGPTNPAYIYPWGVDHRSPATLPPLFQTARNCSPARTKSRSNVFGNNRSDGRRCGAEYLGK
jgi:heptosyltransferase-2